MEERSRKKKISIIMLSVFAFVAVISVTYAFITQTLTGEKQVVVSAGVLDLVLEEENAITISDALPMHDEVGMMQEDVFVFRLVNKTANPTNYILKLTKIDTDNELSEDDVKYYLTKEGVGEPKLLSSLSVDRTVDSGIISGNDTIDYTLRLWIDSGVTDQTMITGKSLSYRIDVEVSQEKEKLPSFVERLENKVQESSETFPNFKLSSSVTNGRGIYKYQEDGEDIYYWRGDVDQVEGAANHVIFADLCWEMVRTTKNGGVKVIYDGTPVEVDGVKTCSNTGNESQLKDPSSFNSFDLFNWYNYPTSVGYMYGTIYDSSYNDKALTTPGILYGNDVEWTGTEYKLKAKDGESLFSSTGTMSNDAISIGNGNHYTCFDSDGICENVSYIYYVGLEIHGSNKQILKNISLSNGITIEKALEQMYNNEQPSTIKTAIETWFESTDLDEEENLSKLEDAVYCNDRSIIDVNNGWYKDGDANRAMYYAPYTRQENGTPTLSCSSARNNGDRFTYKDTKNGNGKLKWPVGLLTLDEAILAGAGEKENYSNTISDFYLFTGAEYFLMSPSRFRFIMENGDFASIFSTGSNNYTIYDFSDNTVGSSQGVRPVITLSSDVEITGVGTESSPYIAK